MTSEIDDRALKVADCEAGAEDKTARAVKHKYHAAPEGQQYDLGLNDERSQRPVFKKSAPFFSDLRDHIWWNACFGGGPTEPNRASFKNYLQKPSPCRTNP